MRVWQLRYNRRWLVTVDFDVFDAAVNTVGIHEWRKIEVAKGVSVRLIWMGHRGQIVVIGTEEPVTRVARNLAKCSTRSHDRVASHTYSRNRTGKPDSSIERPKVVVKILQNRSYPKS